MSTIHNVKPLPLSGRKLGIEGMPGADWHDQLAIQLQKVTTARRQLASKYFNDKEIRKLFYLFPGQGSKFPAQRFVITQPLVEQLSLPDLREDKLLELCLKNTDQTVTSDFDHQAINQFNIAYYRGARAFSPESGLAGMFVSNPAINQALAKVIGKSSKSKKIKVRELCTGGRFDRWITISKHLPEKVTIDLTLTDFNDSILPDIDLYQGLLTNFKLHRDTYNLLDPMPKLGKNKVDALLITYGFDSVWFPEDKYLIKHNNNWYQAKFRLKVPDWVEQRQEVIDFIRAANSDDADPNSAVRDGLAEVLVEIALEAIDIDKLTYGKYIKQHFANIGDVRVNFPGGLITKVNEAFTNSIKSSGTFIIGDVALYDIQREYQVTESSVSGVAAKYKVENYLLAKHILEQEYGYQVTLQGVAEFVESELGKDAEAKIDPEKYRDQCVMVIRRRTTDN